MADHGFEFGDEMLGGVAAVPFGVFEADQVGEGFVAEEQRQVAGNAARQPRAGAGRGRRNS